MSQNFMESKLPPIYRRNNQDAYLDPIRQKLIYVTPEETIRQHIISYLIDELKVPKNMIRVEEPISHYVPKAKGRVDIIIETLDEERNVIFPLALIECKAPDVYLDDKALHQILSYDEKLCSDYCLLTNGFENICYKFENDEYIQIDKLPTYEEMLKGKYQVVPPIEQLPRLKFNELEDGLEDYVDGGFIGENTPRQLALPMINFLECLLYIEHKFPVKSYKIFKLIEDYGIRFITHGDAGGYKYTKPYRSFLIEYNESVEFVSISFISFYEDKTIICVSIDENEKPHHSLQLNVDKNIIVDKNKIEFFHNGNITVGDKGAAPIDGLRKLVAKEYPKIIDGDRFYLGSLTNNKLWNLDDPDVVELVENLISYSLIRDEYREYIKSHR